MKRLIMILLIATVISLVSGEAFSVEPVNYIGFYSDMERNILTWDPVSVYTMCDVYTWMYAGPGGVMCAEYKAAVVEYCIQVGEPYLNPDIVSWSGSLYGPPGGELCFDTCQEGWVFLSQTTVLNVLVSPPCEVFVNLATHDDSGEKIVTDCGEVQAIHDLEHLNVGYINCNPLWYRGYPYLSEVEPVSHLALDIQYPHLEYPSYQPQFSLYNESDPLDTIPITGFIFGTYPSWISRIELGSSMESGTTYVLVGRGCSLNGLCMVSWKRFYYESPVATALQGFDVSMEEERIVVSWELSEIDEISRFDILRGGPEPDFREIGHTDIESGRLSYRFVDEGFESGERYIYKVQYSLGDDVYSLFMTEPVETPIAAFALEQNYPNPFNPATTISYVLPAASFVNLEIYDVKGRRVRTLVSHIQEPGVKRVEWNGLDDAGARVVSGVYFYRLRAGKEELTKKMVLMR